MNEPLIRELVGNWQRKLLSAGSAMACIADALDTPAAVPEPPAGIGNYLLQCGHVAQMKTAYVRLHLSRFMWCQVCQGAQEITQAPDQEVRT
jgi:hypothetical protein